MDKTEAQIKKEQEVLADTVAAKNRVQGEVEELDQQKKSKQIESDSLDQTISDKKTLLNSLQESFEIVQKQHSEGVTSLGDTLSRHEQLTNEIAGLEDRKLSIENDIAESQDYKAEAIGIINKDLLAAKREAHATLASLGEEIATRQSHVKSLEDTASANEGILATQNTEMEALHAKKAEAQGAMAACKAELASVERSVQDENKRLAEVKNEAQGAIVELASHEFNINAKKAELEGLNNETEELNKQKFAFQQRVAGFAQREAFIKAKYEEAGVAWQE